MFLFTFAMNTYYSVWKVLNQKWIPGKKHITYDIIIVNKWEMEQVTALWTVSFLE